MVKLSDEAKNIQFRNTVGKITEEYGARGFTAKKTAASDILGEDIKTARGEKGAESIAVAGVLDNLESAQQALQSSTDPQSTKEILKTTKDLKQVIKNLAKSGDLGGEQQDSLNDLIRQTEKNVKKVSKAGGAFGKANETFLGSLTETLNPLSAMGNFFGTAGIAPLEGYFNSLGDSLNEKVKGALGIGASEESLNMTRDIQKQDKKEIETEFRKDSEDNASVLTKEGTTSTAGKEGAPGMEASDILVPDMSLMKRVSLRLGRALGLTDQSGKSYLAQLVDQQKGDPASRAEKPDSEGLDALPGGDDGEPDDEGKKKKGGIMGMLSGLAGAAGAGIGAGLKAVSMGVRSLAMSVMMLAAPPALVGLAAITLALIGIGTALRIATPALKVFGKVITKIVEVIGDTFLGAMERIPPIMESIGGVIETIGGAISNVVETVLDSLTDTIERLGNVDGKNLLVNVAPGLAAVGAALGVFGAGSGIGAILSGFGSLFGDGPLEQISKIDGKNIQNAADGIDKFGGALKKLDKDIEAFGDSNAPKILKDFTQTMDGFTESMPSAFQIGKMAAFGLSFSSLQSTAADFVKNMTIIADPTAPAQTDNLNDAQKAAASSSGTGSSNTIAVNQGGNVQNVNNTTNNTTSNSSPQDRDFDYYAFRGVSVHA
jgi:hypothetical protein